jgi:hypothetical protein
VAEKPAHVITIPDSLGRDVDKAREGKIAPPPMEAFMSDAALEQVEQQTAAAAAPLHAEDLVPITRQEGARRTTFDGETLPNLPATRRVLPPPFRRPQISIDHHGREWASCPVEAVKAGDMVIDVGRVACDPEEEVQRDTVAGVSGVAIGMKVILTGISGNRLAYEPGSSVRAFRLAELWAWGGDAVPASGRWTSAAGLASPATGTRRTST